jgi:hypothetical protein
MSELCSEYPIRVDYKGPIEQLCLYQNNVTVRSLISILLFLYRDLRDAHHFSVT